MLQVQEKLKSYNIEATVVDPIFVKPIDAELFSALLLTHTHVVTLEEHSLQGALPPLFNLFFHKTLLPLFRFYI